MDMLAEVHLKGQMCKNFPVLEQKDTHIWPFLSYRTG